MGGDLRIIAPDQEQNRQELFELIAKAFPQRGYWNRIRYCENGYIDGSTYDWNASRIGILDGKIVTHCGIWEYRLRIGEAVVRFAGVGGIATDGDYLQRGLMSRTMRAGLADLPAAGYPASFLFGIENYYHKFGYVAAWPAQKWSVSRTDLPAVPPPFLMEEIREGWTELSDLYNRENRSRTGTAVRPTYRTNRRPERWVGYRWGREPSGYLVIEEEEDALQVIDAAGSPDELLTALGHLARSRCSRQVTFAGIPFDGDLARTIRQGNARLEVSYRRSGGAMARIEGLNRLLRELLPEFSTRLAESPFRNLDISLRFVLRREPDLEESATLLARGGQAEIRSELDVGVLPAASEPAFNAAPPQEGSVRGQIRGGDALIRLILGSDAPDDVIRESDIVLDGDIRSLVPVLFPARHPILSGWDRF